MNDPAPPADQPPAATAADLLPLVYEELRKLAAAKMSRESSGQTLQATALVHEAWLRLGGDAQPLWRNRAQFFAAAAEAMRRILIDRARTRHTARRGGDLERVEVHESQLPADGASDARLLAIDEALERFAQRAPEKAALVKLRYFTGLNHAEAAQLLGISEITAKRWWAYARAWLYAEIKDR